MDESKVVELEKYWKVVRENPSDFAGWTYLLHFIEQENNIEAAREAFGAFFKHYPYCYGYWKKYADIEKNLNNFEAAEKIYVEGTKAIPLSVDLWIHYLNFYKELKKDEESAYDDIRALFRQALTTAGHEFRSDRLWELYISWQEENKNLKEVTAAYDELLGIPTQLYSHHFEKFRKHIKKNSPREVLSTDEFLELRKEILASKPEVGGLADEEDADDGKDVDKPMDANASIPELDDAPPGLEPASGNVDIDMLNSEETDALKKKIVEIRRVVYDKNEIEVGKRWTFEESIKRPYFHVKPLERSQLKNWKEYLDYEIANGTHESVVILFERCMIACALYEDLWLKYAKYMQEKNSDATDGIFERACTIHLPKKPNLHFVWATFQEKKGNFEKAAEILLALEERVKDMLEVTLRRINLERRQGNHDKVEELYTKCIDNAQSVELSSHFSNKYARYLYKIKGDFAKATEVLKTALAKDSANIRIYTQLIDVGFQQNPIDLKGIQETFELALNSDITVDQKLQFAQRKLEIFEDFSSDCQSIQDACEEYSKMLKSFTSTKKRVAEDGNDDAKEKKAKTELNGTDLTSDAAAVATTTATTTDATYQQYQHAAWANYQNSYGYQQGWPATAYGTSNYYSSSN